MNLANFTLNGHPLKAVAVITGKASYTYKLSFKDKGLKEIKTVEGGYAGEKPLVIFPEDLHRGCLVEFSVQLLRNNSGENLPYMLELVIYEGTNEISRSTKGGVLLAGERLSDLLLTALKPHGKMHVVQNLDSDNPGEYNPVINVW